MFLYKQCSIDNLEDYKTCKEARKCDKSKTSISGSSPIDEPDTKTKDKDFKTSIVNTFKDFLKKMARMDE